MWLPIYIYICVSMDKFSCLYKCTSIVLVLYTCSMVFLAMCMSVHCSKSARQPVCPSIFVIHPNKYQFEWLTSIRAHMLLIRIFCWVLNCCCHCICVSASLILPACHCLLLVLLLLQLVFYLFFNLHLFSYRITEEHLTNSNPKWWSTSIYSQRCKIFWCIKLSKFGILALRHHIVWLLLIPMITILPLKRILIRNTILVNWITLFLHNILVYKRSWLKWTLSTVSDSPYTTQTSWQTLAV